MNFTSIYLKFANNHQSSLFEVDLVKVKDGNIIEKRTVYHKPTPGYFDYSNKFIFDITNEKEINDIISKRSKLLDLDPSSEIIIGNYPNEFDLLHSNILKNKNLNTHVFHLRDLAKRLFPELSNYQIDTLFNTLFGKNDKALNHAEKTAFIAIELLKQQGVHDFASLTKRLTQESILLDFDRSSAYNILKNKRISFMENMETITRKNAQRIAALAGGIVKPGNLSTKTNFLVIGQKKYNEYLKSLPSKIQKIKKTNSDLEVISEKTFLEIVIFKPLPNEVTIEKIKKDSNELLKRNKYNEFSGKRVFFSEDLSINKLHAFQLVGNCSGFGHDYDKDSIPFTDFFVISSHVIELLKKGEKTKSILDYEKLTSKSTEKAGSTNIEEELELSKKIYLIDEDTFLEYMNRREQFQKGQIKMNLHESDIQN